MFALEDRKKAVLQLIEFDMQYATTTRKLGYPCNTLLNKRIHELAPEEKDIVHLAVIHYTLQEKKGSCRNSIVY